MCPVSEKDLSIEDKILGFLDECDGECTDLALFKFIGASDFTVLWHILYNIFDSRCPTYVLSWPEFWKSVKSQGYAFIPDNNIRPVKVKLSMENPKEEVLPTNIKEWCSTIYTWAEEKGWWNDFNFPEKLALIHSEISEALEEYRNGKDYKEIYYSDKGKPEGIPIELADAVIRIMDLCAHCGIDLEEAIALKHKYNLTRPYKHGGKVC